jgi:hypothetical protein
MTDEQPPAAEPPPPGSDQAIKAGSLFPRFDNNRGRGYMGMPGIYVMREDCPLHGSNKAADTLSIPIS